MRRTLFGIGLTVAAATLGAAIVGAQATGATEDQRGRADQSIGVPQGRGGMGPARGIGQGRGVGRAPGMMIRRGGPQGARGFGQMGRGSAQFGRGGSMRGRGGPGGGLARLNLTDEQRSRVADLHRAERDQAGPLRDQLTLARRTLHRELFADARNGGRIAELSASIAKFEQQLAELHLKTTAAVADVLTAEQRETMRLRDGRGRGPGGGGPAGPGAGRGRFGGGPRGPAVGR